jgi:hypothetical protein
MIQRALLASGVLYFTAGCTSETASCEGEACDLELSEQPAFAVGGFVPWALSSGQLRLCFTRDPSLTTTEFTAVRDRVVTVLNQTWGSIPGLDFVSSCTAPSMSITLNDGAGAGFCGLGNGAACSIGADPANLPSVDGVAVHEVGHGLGMLHEHQMPGAAPLCANEAAILAGCTSCNAATCTAAQANACWFAVPAASSITVSAADKALATSRLASGVTACLPCSQGTCTVGSCDNATCTPAASYWGCFGANPTTGTVNVSTGDRGSAAGRVNDRTVVTTGKRLTRYDPKSIMNYCAAVNGGRTDDVPTPLDLLGMEMLYSTNRTHALGCGNGCFVTSTGLVTSTSGSLVSEWIARGSVDVPFKVSGTSSNVYSYSVSGLPNGTSTVNYTFVDPVNRSRSGSGSVTKSNTAYAALAGAVAMIY